MIIRVKKKLFLFLIIFLNLSVVIIGDVVENEDKVVMKLVESENYAEPRVLISRHNAEVRDNQSRIDTNTAPKIEDSIEIERSKVPVSENIFYQRFNFPHNLQIIREVLMKLQNAKCVADTTRTLEAMVRHERWAIEMFDSFPKFPVGILYGNYFQLGNFDECVGVRNKEAAATDNDLIQGQYCLADIHFKSKNDGTGRAVRSLQKVKTPNRYEYNRSVIHWGICLPSSCTPDDASIFTREIFSVSAENFEVVSVIVDEEKCSINTTKPITSAEIIYGAVVGSFLIFVLLATFIHCWYLRRCQISVAYHVDSVTPKRKNTFNEIITCFSLIHTTKKFLQTKQNELNLECICGIKFLSMSTIIAGHSLIFIFGGPVENANFVQMEITNIANGVFTNNPLLVDTFLLVSGFLMCRLLLIELDKRKGKINFAILYIARYIRLTPAYLVMLGFYCTWLYRMGSGPFWNTKIGLERERCLQSWWTNILYVNNYVNTDKLCMFQSWYLSVDYHLFIIAPFVVYPLWRWSKFGETLLAICTTVSVVVPFWLTYQNNYDPTLMAYPPEIEDLSSNYYFLNVYMKTHMRSSSYCVGILFGYLVHKLQNSGKKIPSYIVYLGWTISSILAAISMFSIVIFYNPDHETNSFESAIYASLHRLSWCLAIGWVLVACITDNAAMVNRFLSQKFFIPASRLTYCAYLANGLIEIYNVGVQRQPVYLSKYELVCKILGHQLLTFGIAFILCIIFESPIHGLEKILLKREKVKEVTQQQSTMRPVGEA